MSKNRLRSQLANPQELKNKLSKIKGMHLVFEVGGSRFPASACTNVLIDETATHNQIQFQRPGGSTVEQYELADVSMVRRLRTKKWMIEIKGNANPAAAT